MRISREDEHYIGRARPALHSRAKVAFEKDGRITAVDLFVVVDNGPYDQVGDGRSAGDAISLSVSAEGDAVAGRGGADQHAAARRPARAGRDAGHRDHGADSSRSGAASWASTRSRSAR